MAVTDIGLRQATLDEVFLRLTGHSAEGGPEPDGEAPDPSARSRRRRAASSREEPR